MGILRAGLSWERKRGCGRRWARFAPRVEGLEGRALLAVLTVNSAADSGMGSLRAEVAAAADGDIINFDSSLDGQTITLTSGPLKTQNGLTIVGPGANMLTISGNNASAIFDFTGSGTSVTIASLTLADGSATHRGGAINDSDFSGTLNVSNCTFTGDVATTTESEDIAGGGAIYSMTAQLKVDQCTFANNQAMVAGESSGGGAIAATSGSVQITNSTFTSNQAMGVEATSVDDTGPPAEDAQGGAVSLMPESAQQVSVAVTGNNFATNQAVGGNTGVLEGGGNAIGGALFVYISGEQGPASVSVSENTFTGNAALGGSGGSAGSATGGSVAIDAGGSSGTSVELHRDKYITGRAVGGASMGTSSLLDGGAAEGGAIALLGGLSSGATFHVNQEDIQDTRAIGGACGDSTDASAPMYHGGDASGGGIYVDAESSRNALFEVYSSGFFFDRAVAGDGGSAPADDTNPARPLTSFAGGKASGGGVAMVTTDESSNPTFNIRNTTADGCTAYGGTGGQGAADANLSTNFQGGPGGAAFGGGAALIISQPNAATANVSGTHFFSCTAQGGTGGAGGQEGSFQNGGAGGDGGTGWGGGLAIDRTPDPYSPNGGGTSAFQAAVSNCEFSTDQALGGNGAAGGQGYEGGQGGAGGQGIGGGMRIFGAYGSHSDKVTLQNDYFVNISAPFQTNNVAQGGNGGAGGFGVRGYGGNGGAGGEGDGGGLSIFTAGTVLIKNGRIAYNRAAGGTGGAGGDGFGGILLGKPGNSNRGFGGGVSAFSYKSGGKDVWSGNLVIDYNVADANPNVDGKLVFI
jgi:hypothetical protein